MKSILISLSAAALVLCSASCRTFVPVDPNTGKPGCNMMPDKVTPCCTKDCTPCCSSGEAKPSK